ncbi:hypothetical protein M430DRAFT_47402 [Amorphotheca resinae ATCC 22711]|uniref:HAUS augmin-like complex subunit 3 N-terminal domain-containing protein n=1 Tax=Amorphotheca resinae ATCC 22711 TaxID=857342 RepID=A0A2T3BG56_AMORE|nr:hypothetical protein M430DRAFT_47402 [Amorphotheca resinae ATCC 22711]PSS28396.1 hypothetical protein M430DRAFT_47402 [Amorphotheca resinae ATCC 22711]
MADNSFNSLIEVLHSHGVQYDHDALKSAFDDPESQATIEAWVQEYLSPETLLTKDEATLYAALVKSGEADAFAASQDLSAIRGLNDQDMQQAIEELQRSTAAIEKQSETLRLQQNAMKMLINSSAQVEQARSQTNKSQQRKWDMERGHIITAVKELSQNLKDQTADLEQQNKASETAVMQTVENLLRSDDKLLSSLQKLATDLDSRQPEDDGISNRIRELCARLIKHTVEGIRTRLDRIYLDALNNPAGFTNSQDVNDQEVVDLQEELESLYAEILPVAQMSAEQQFLQPALREIAARNGLGQERSVKAIKYIHDCLDFLVNRVEVFLDRAQEYQCHKMALQFVIDEAKKELLRVEASSADKKTSSATTVNLQRRKSSSAQPPAKARHTRRRSSIYPEEEIEPEQQLLRNLGISLPADAVSDQPRIEALERALLDRASKLEGHASTLQSTTESSISSHLLDAHVTLHLLRDSLLADSPYNNVQLLDSEIQSSITGLEEDLQDLQQKLEAVNLQKLQERNVHREQLIERWSR